MNNGLFLPLEVVKREYLGRLCLAVEMAARGMPVFIGHKKWIIRLALEAAEPGIFFYKDAARGEWFVPKLMEKGFGLVAQDEEAGIIYSDYEQFYKRRRSLDNVPNLHRFFSWGDADYEFLKDRFCTGERCNVVNTGAVKTVFWGEHGARYFEDSVRNLRARYGRYVIFVTNFAVGNSYLPASDLLQLGEKNDENVRDLYRERLQKESRLMRFAAGAARRIAEKSGFKVIVRPHPTESVESWKRETRGLEGVCVEADGDLSPWILGAEGVLHNSCTSGIQAAASGVPVVAFGEEEGDLAGPCSVPNDVSIPAIGMAEVLDTVSSLQECRRATESSRRTLLTRKLTGAGSLEPLKNNADALLELSGRPNGSGNRELGGDSVLLDLKELYRTSSMWPRTRQRVLDQSKRPKIKKRGIHQDVASLARLLGAEGQIEVGRVGRNSYRLWRKS